MATTLNNRIRLELNGVYKRNHLDDIPVFSEILSHLDFAELAIDQKPEDLVKQVRSCWDANPQLREAIMLDTHKVILLIGRGLPKNKLMESRITPAYTISSLPPEWHFEIHKNVGKPNPLVKAPVAEEE